MNPGLVNPDRRHDDPEEVKADEIRQAIRDEHRFTSFAEERANNFVKWYAFMVSIDVDLICPRHVDGHDYMWALSEMIDRAKEAIFILDWWLTPELFLRRPPADHLDYRLDRLLKRKAEQGVKIYVVVYKEVTQTMTMSSSHTKHTLEDLHPNITCLRHPDHIGSKDSVQFWSHHEKVVVVDNHYACIGGLDLCFGRWDTHNHPLADVHPMDFSRTLFAGQDYNNARIQDFKEVKDFASNTLSRLESARMPWHDVHMSLTGPVVLDIVQHFVERWNEIKKRKYRNDAFVSLSMCIYKISMLLSGKLIGSRFRTTLKLRLMKPWLVTHTVNNGLVWAGSTGTAGTECTAERRSRRRLKNPMTMMRLSVRLRRRPAKCRSAVVSLIGVMVSSLSTPFKTLVRL